MRQRDDQTPKSHSSEKSWWYQPWHVGGAGRQQGAAELAFVP